jgi:hypothetical protein
MVTSPPDTKALPLVGVRVAEFTYLVVGAVQHRWPTAGTSGLEGKPMNTKPIESARDSDLRLSHAALQRAALRARELALQTGTSIVVVQHGVLKQIHPAAQGTPLTVQAPVAPCGELR